MLLSRLLLLSAVLATTTASTAYAGIPECGGIRLEDVASCEVRADVECTAGCDELGIYETACATRLHTVCRSECTLSADATCTDDCTVMCQAECDAGVSITCQHNCFGECSGACVDQCAGATDASRCRATCEATCDGECDIQCAPVVDGDCYYHCVECCGGSCTAQANMDCQESCQVVEFEDCEHEFRADCMASCDVDGALFCDGKYVLAGSEIPTCIDALLAQGISVEAEGSVSIGPGGATTSCSTTEPGVPRSPAGGLALLLATAWLAIRRRR